MDKDKILDYVRKTPANTNPNVLKTMLDDSGSEMNPGYSCTETVTLLTDESVTTVFDEVNNSGKLAYSTSIDANTIRVTFDGTEYTCNVQDIPMGKAYGAPMGEEGLDWSEYPFQIVSGLRNDIYTESAGTYRIKIETVEEIVETTPCFKKAINSVVGDGKPLIINIITTQEGQKTISTLDRTWKEIRETFPNVCIHLESHDDSRDAESWLSVKQIDIDDSLEKPYVVRDAHDISYQAELENEYPTSFYDGGLE